MKIVEAMNELDHPYAPHLVIRNVSLAPGKEWSPGSSGWSLIQIGSGTGYWLQGQARQELESGMILLVAGDKPGRVLASRLNGMQMSFFSVIPERLTGLITQGEQDFFNRSAERKELSCQIVPPQHPAALKMKELSASPRPGGLSSRLTLLQLWNDVLGGEQEQAPAEQTLTDVKERLRVFLLETPPDALLEITFEELAQMTHCTPRHLSRVFFDLAGMSFRDKRAEIRLARARELLATSDSKVVDVAMKSGYKSLSLFNRMFTRRFGLSPGRWRQKNNNGQNKGATAPAASKARVAVNQRRFQNY
jgi:AraC-like DNA-binding protein